MYICNHNTIKLIDNYLHNYINSNLKIKPIFLHGLSGSSKSFSIISLLKKHNIDINYYDNYKNYNELENNLFYNDILKYFKNSKKSIILDNFSNEQYQNIYNNIELLFKKYKVFNILIIIISNNIYKKKNKFYKKLL